MNHNDFGDFFSSMKLTSVVFSKIVCWMDNYKICYTLPCPPEDELRFLYFSFSATIRLKFHYV